MLINILILEMSEDEVLGLDMGSSSDDEDDDEEVAFDDDEEEDEDEILLRNLKKGLKRSLNDSDNEQGGEDDDDEEDETAWGRSKRAYYNGEDLIEGRNKNRDDENDEIEKEEEAEAMRLQKKRAAAMMESDFIEDSFASRLHRTEEVRDLEMEFILFYFPLDFFFVIYCC